MDLMLSDEYTNSYLRMLTRRVRQTLDPTRPLAPATAIVQRGSFNANVVDNSDATRSRLCDIAVFCCCFVCEMRNRRARLRREREQAARAHMKLLCTSLQYIAGCVIS